MPNNTMKPGDELDLGHNIETEADGQVECLGRTFENDQARREYYLELLAEKLRDPEFRKIEGFPIGEDEDILNLSDPPYYTACPNPFIERFITFYGRPYDPSEDYKREPYAADVSEGKNDPIYNAHSYHTKVPHKAIMRYILHYTNPGDVLLDGFCGSGMTGVAAQLCGDKLQVESLGYRVLNDGSILREIQDGGSATWVEFSTLGVRKVVLNDISPAAYSIAYTYNVPVDEVSFESDVGRIIKTLTEKCSWMYETLHNPTGEELVIAKGKVAKGLPLSKVYPDKAAQINYSIWSDVFICSECGHDLVFWDCAVNIETAEVSDPFLCPSCNAELSKRKLNRSMVSRIDQYSGEAVVQSKQVPVLINYKLGSKRFQKKPDSVDLILLDFISNNKIESWFPGDELMDGKETKRNVPIGITNVHHFYTTRNLAVFAEYLNLSSGSRWSKHLYGAAKDCHSYATKMIKLNVRRLLHGGGQFMGFVGGTLYVPSLHAEQSTLSSLITKTKKVVGNYKSSEFSISNVLAQAGSLTDIKIPSNSLDYIFLDPPFGANISYSELNFIWESWLKVKTNIEKEAIENTAHQKGADEYRGLMAACFNEAYRVLKPGRWMTVEFSNTKASVWNSIQLALTEAGFIVANVSALDKKQGSFKVMTTPTAVKQDLIISVYKPNGGFEQRFEREGGVDGVWDFVRTHLGYLPVVKRQQGELVKIPERDPRIIFDQVVSYFVRNVRDVPLSSKEFQEGLLERFAERDSMIFLPEQVTEYDKARISSSQLRQLTIFVDDEASAIEWLRQLLNEKPQTYQDIHPKFINELSGWKKAEDQLELSKLLEQSFLKYDGEGLLPPQIHSHLSTYYKEMRNLSKDNSQLIKKARDRWYVPNPEREEDLQKLRERGLLKQFHEYKSHTGRKLKTVRLEAVRCGFKKAWEDRDYVTIINVAEKIPQNLLQEDQKLLMWYDQAQTRHSDESLF